MSSKTNIFELSKLSLCINEDNAMGNFAVQSIRTTCFFQKISTAEIKISRGHKDATSMCFKTFDDKKIVPGSPISLVYDNIVLFKGEVIKHSLEVEQNESYITIEAKHRAHQLSVNRKNKVFANKTDSEVINEIIQENEMTAKVEATQNTHESIVQYNVTDWDFANIRAEANGLYLFTYSDAIHAIPLKLEPKAKHTLSYDKTIYELGIEIDGRFQFENYSAGYWDYALQQASQKERQNQESRIAGLDAAYKKSKLQPNKFSQNLFSYNDDKEVDAGLQAIENRYGFSRVRGKIGTSQLFDLLPGDTIALAGIGQQYDGKVLVSGVEHILENNAWKTIVHIGIDHTPYKKLYDDIDSPQADNHWAATQGLFTAKVKQIEKDPKELFRVLVEFPGFEGKTPAVWARLAHAYAGNQYGCFVIPEVGDEVIVGFVNNNPKDVVVIGSVYSSKLPPTQKIEKENKIKGFYSKAQIKIEINEEDKSLLLSTPDGNTILLHDKDKKIVLEDQHSNTFTMHKDGIDIVSAKNINIKAPQGDINMQANNVNTKCNVAHKVEASTQVEIKSSGTAVLKGSIVQIN